MKFTRLITLSGPALLLLSSLFPPAPVFCQAASGSTQVGYGIVTVAFGSITNLKVVETFGFSSGSTISQGSVAPATLATQAALLVSVDPSLQRDTGMAIANPGPSNANLTLTLFDSSGLSVATRTITVLSGRQTARFVTEIFAGTPNLNQPFDGTLVLTSDFPVGITALRFRGPGFSSLPLDIRVASSNPLPLIFGGSVGGPTAVMLSHVAAGGGWASQIAVGNSGSFPMIVRIDFFDQNGIPLTVSLNNQSGSSFTNVQIPSGGVVILSTPPGQSGVPAF